MMNDKIYELCICAIEQGYSIEFEGIPHIDLIVYQRLTEICGEDLKNGR